MDVLLTHGYFIREDEKESKIMKPYPPLGILYISSYLKQHKVDVEVFDTTFSSFEAQIAYITEHQPKIVAVYTNLVTKLNVIKLVKHIKSTSTLCNIKVVLGGPDVTYNIENYLKMGADFIVIGEGEQSTYELSKAILNHDNFTDIPGIAFVRNNLVCKNSSREKIKNIDELPFPDRGAINLHQYLKVWKQFHGKSTISISTQRGCPYTCKWCSTAVYGQSYRRRSPELVADEIEKLKATYNPDSLWFVDDVFTVSHKWIEGLYDEFKKRNIAIGFECITRAERLNEDILFKLKEMGCEKIWIGAESGSQKIIDKMDRRVDVEKVQEMIIKTQKLGIDAGTFIMVGYPDETIKDIKQTVYHLKRSLPNQFTITVTYPITGTDLYNEVYNLMETNINWETTTDRDIRFKRKYSDTFYDYAVRYIVNSVESHRNLTHKKKYIRGASQKLKATVSRIMMMLV